jgi:hypothetical protein
MNVKIIHGFRNPSRQIRRIFPFLACPSLLRLSGHRGRLWYNSFNRSLRGVGGVVGIRDNPEYGRERAEQARKLAGEISDRWRRERMLKVAKDYDAMADKAEARSRRSRFDRGPWLAPGNRSRYFQATSTKLKSKNFDAAGTGCVKAKTRWHVPSG